MTDIRNIGDYLSFTDWNGVEMYINIDEVSVIEMPLVEVERKSFDSVEE